MAFQEFTFLGNGVERWLMVIGGGLLSLTFLSVTRRFLLSRFASVVEQTPGRVDDVLLGMLARTRWLFRAVVSFYAFLPLVQLGAKAELGVSRLTFIVFLYQLGVWASYLISDWVNRHIENHLVDNQERATTVKAIGFLLRFLLYSVIFLWGLDNLGVNVTALVAGLGVGGVAVALAVQNILGDLFASLTIVLDKPFTLGDHVTVGEMTGTIEHIGLKTTRMRGQTGEQLIFSNSDLLQSRIRNFKKLEERRGAMTFGVAYDTPIEKLERLPGQIKGLAEAQGKVRFERAHLMRMGETALQFEVIFWVRDSDYGIFMDAQQELYLSLLRHCQKELIELRHPTAVPVTSPLQRLP